LLYGQLGLCRQEKIETAALGFRSLFHFQTKEERRKKNEDDSKVKHLGHAEVKKVK